MSVYEELSDTKQFACRVIADHARSTAFSIADGILPGNEGRNYVLRKIMRRAIYHGREHLGLKDLFFFKVCDFVIDEMKGAYPELEAQREFIGKMVRLEEERFGNTLTVGMKELQRVIAEFDVSVDSHSIVSDFPTDKFAKIYDTYGVPIDLIFVALRSHLEQLNPNLPFFSSDTFSEIMTDAIRMFQQKSGIGHTERKSQISPVYAEVLEKVGANKFTGYETTHMVDVEVVAILDGETPLDSLAEGSQGGVVLKETPFYAESGGQVGDTGFISGQWSMVSGQKTAELKATVNDTFSPVAGLIIHKVKVDKGSIKVGDKVAAIVDVEKRDATRRNHTATHLVHAALKEVLGSHVKQAGSVVAPNYLRFDFTHYQPITDTELVEIEDIVNRHILENETVSTNIMPIDEAIKGGATALFGEKYGSDVRVLSVGDGEFSKELCGGTHVRATGDIGSFKITADEAIASGVRRIRAITGFGAFERFREDENLIDRSLGALKTQRDQLPNAIERLQDELKKTRKEIEDLKLKIATGTIGGASSNGDEARDVAGVKVVGKIVEGLDGNGTRQLSDTLLARLKSGVVVLGRKDEGKAGIIVRVSDDLTGKIKAGNVIKEIVPILGGKGGGRPDMAEGGGPEAEKLAEAIDASYSAIEKMLG